MIARLESPISSQKGPVRPLDNTIDLMLAELDDAIEQTRAALRDYHGNNLILAQMAKHTGDMAALYRIAYGDGVLRGALESFVSIRGSLVDKVQRSA